MGMGDTPMACRSTKSNSGLPTTSQKELLFYPMAAVKLSD